MITGDSRKTAVAISQAVGILSADTAAAADDSTSNNRVFSGAEFFVLTPVQQLSVLNTSSNLVV